MRKSRILPILAALTLLAALLAAVPGLADNLLENPGFEAVDDSGLPLGWGTSAYLTAEGYTEYSVSDDAYEGSSCAVISNFGANDARFEQTVAVEPSSLYRLSGWIKASDIGDYGWGANFSVYGVYLDTDSVYETDGEWVYTEMYGETDDDQSEITVYVRLGGYSGESEGTAGFDNVCLEKIDALPDGAIAQPWYTSAVTYAEEETEEEDDGTASPFWPWLLAFSALWLAMGVWVMTVAVPAARDLRQPQKMRMPAWVMGGLALTFVLRWIIATLTEGYAVDVNCFRSWAATMASVGPAKFYTTTSFCDYPPAYMLVLGFTQLIENGLTGLLGTVPDFLRMTVLIKMLPMLCDTGMAVLVWKLAAERTSSREQAGALALWTALCPALILNSAAWCQVDAVLCLLLAVTVVMAFRHRWHIALPVYMLAVLVKPQALMAGPVGLIALLMEFMPGLARKIRPADDAEKPAKDAPLFGVPACLKSILTGLGGMVAVALIVLLPFLIGSENTGLAWLIEKYSDTLSSYPYATVNTANLYYLFGGNWSSLVCKAEWGVPLVLAALCALWGVWCLLTLKKRRFPMPWLEPALMAVFCVWFIVCAAAGLTWAHVGYAAMGLAFAVCVPLMLRSGRTDTLPLLGALLFILLYALGIKMHERYLFPALVLLMMAFVIHRDVRLLAVMALVSCTVFVNEGIVLDNSNRLGSSMGHLNDDTWVLNMILSVLNVAAAGLAMWTAGGICLKGDATPPAETPLKKLLPESRRMQEPPTNVRNFTTDPKLHWKKLDTVLMLSVTLVYSAVALWNLGSTRAPQTFWTTSSVNEQAVFDLGGHYDDFCAVYYCAVSYNNFSLAVSDDGETWSKEIWCEMNEGSCYAWKYVMPSYGTGSDAVFNGGNSLDDVKRMSGRYVRVSSQQIALKLGEIIFRDADGNTIPVTLVSQTGANAASSLSSSAALCIDEPDSLVGEPGWYTGTYFDEIYHARTAKELLDGTTIYEWTHPQLGKLLMGLGIRMFGMTPFGWRFMGALMGILMLPLMYLFGKQLTRKSWMAFTAMTLMALDCMHLTQTRLATVDSYVVVFIIAACFFMARFMQYDLTQVKITRLLPSLGLSGLSIACAIASKWTGLYAGVGLAVLYFWTMARHLRLMREARAVLKSGAQLTGEERAVLTVRAGKTWKRLLCLCAWCVLFFVVVPVVTYLLSYLAHFAHEHITDLGTYIRRVIEQQESMYSYHSTPGLGMDHAFYSPWYEWPFNIRPMYYAMAYYQPEGMSCAIFCFGNPTVWTVGLAGVAFTVCLWAKNHLYTLPGRNGPVRLESSGWSMAPALVLICLLAQFLPWVLVPRGTYIYHYFASVPFLILATVLMLDAIGSRWPRAGRALMIALLTAALVMFIGFYPYASGVTTPYAWLDYMKQFLRIYYSK